jgi:hypothetical protein
MRKAFKHTSKYKLKGLRVEPSTKSTARKTTQFVNLDTLETFDRNDLTLLQLLQPATDCL